MDSGGAHTAEEEALKKNTDCVYFLASPLTCKKGNECEYRHSEGARLNPRDCYYWLNSNCLNPKCAFRHPPLDGLFGPPGSGPMLPSIPTVPSKQIPVVHAPPYSLNKQSRSQQCIFFQKGHCLKGEICPFSHETQANGNVVSQQLAKPSPSLSEQPQATLKYESWSIKQCGNQQSIPKVSADIELKAPVSSTKPVIRNELQSSNGFTHVKNLLSKSQPAHAPVINSNAWSRSQNHQIHSSDEHLQNDLEPGEIVGEHSSVFDAHVVNNTKASEFGRKSALNDYHHRSSDYKPVNIYERNQYSSSVDKYSRQNGRIQDYRDTRPHNILSERRSLERSQLPERRVLQRPKSPNEVDRADLRHRLKQRKLDSSRSATRSDHYVEEKDKYYGHHSHRNQLQAPLEASVSSRLRGRITLPAASSGDSFSLQSEERDVSRNRGRLSPTRASISNQVRQNGRARRLSEDPPLRNLGGRLSKRDDVDSLNFNGPKSLAELKGAKLVKRSQEQTTKVQNNEDSPSFEGPKPLSVLLKRKREDVPLDSVDTCNVDENNQRNGVSHVSDCDPVSNKQPQPKVETLEDEKDSIPSRDDELPYDGESSAKDHMEIDAMEDEGLQNFEQRDGEYEDEAIVGGDYKTEYESQGEEEDDELDDEEDFARRAGLLFS